VGAFATNGANRSHFAPMGICGAPVAAFEGRSAEVVESAPD